MSKYYWRQATWLWLSFFVILLDQASKFAVRHFMLPYTSKPIFPGFNLVLAFNKGAAFSFLNDAGGWQKWLFLAIALVISLVLFLLILKNKTRPLLNLSYALIIGGALGNAIDRILFGHVTDFIDVYVKNWHWPAFNIADSAICIGVAMLIIANIFAGKEVTS